MTLIICSVMDNRHCEHVSTSLPHGTGCHTMVIVHFVLEYKYYLCSLINKNCTPGVSPLQFSPIRN